MFLELLPHRIFLLFQHRLANFLNCFFQCRVLSQNLPFKNMIMSVRIKRMGGLHKMELQYENSPTEYQLVFTYDVITTCATLE